VYFEEEGEDNMRADWIRTVLWLVLVLMVGAGCAAKKQPSPVDLKKTAEHFSQRMRWQDYRQAAAFLPTEEREAFVAEWKASKDLHVVGSRIESIEMLDAESGSVVMVIEYYMLPSNAVRETESKQEWRYRPGERFERGFWELVAGMPKAPAAGGSSGKNE